MTLEKDITKLYDNEKPSKSQLYIRPIFILLCFIAGFYAFRVIVIDHVLNDDRIDVYTAGNRMGEGDFEQAEEILKQVLEKQPNYSAANKMLGFLYLQQDELDKALVCYNKALLYSPESEKIENAISLITEKINNDK